MTVLILLDILGSVCVGYDAYFFSVIHFGDPAALSHGPWTLGLNPPITGVCALIVQSCMSTRCKKRWLSLIADPFGRS